MKKMFILLLLIINCSIISTSQETTKKVVFYIEDGDEMSINFEDISSLIVEKIDSLSWIHIFYKKNQQHFIYSSISLDSIWFDHENYTISVVTNGIVEVHSIDSIDNIQINCYKLIIPHKPYTGYPHPDSIGYNNPDSVMVDSCQNPPAIFVRKWFGIIFENYIIDLPAAPEDSLLDVTWESISSSFTLIRNDFEAIENKFGNYTLRKVNPQIIDSTHLGSKYFKVSFNNYVNKDSVINFFRTCHGLNDYWYINNVFVYIK